MKRRIWIVLVVSSLTMLLANSVAVADRGGTLPTSRVAPAPVPTY